MKRDIPNKKIRELENKLKRLEADKEVLNSVIDIADETLDTDIQKSIRACCQPLPDRLQKMGRTVKFVANTLGYSRQYYYKHCK